MLVGLLVSYAVIKWKFQPLLCIALFSMPYIYKSLSRPFKLSDCTREMFS